MKKYLKNGHILTIVFGLLIIASSYLPLFNPPECPVGYTQEQINSSNCIIGANIGAGMIWLLGLLVLLVGALGLLASLLINFIRKNRTTKNI